ncbi:hypothetical protein LS482_02500 [Sinomicrobium kalidii]|uniref:hypothetical protein n=1 Tax=Sinomicrobium kalidii TaxID=2900738 RepID=UPI001E5E8C2D|nr:hypothetical protein [Sinomicrobium kalidii]UGU16751.1 hypothetical protein LS482_02500 [Sinomicrobium kalidii]
MTNIIILISILVSGGLTVFILNAIVNYKIKNKISENEKPLTIVVLKTFMFLISGLLLSELITSFQTLTKILPNSYSGYTLLLREASFFCIFLGILILILFAILWFAAFMFSLLNKGDHIFMETANNNLNAVILFCGILLALTIAIKTGITPILDQFIPYPTMPIYR